MIPDDKTLDRFLALVVTSGLVVTGVLLMTDLILGHWREAIQTIALMGVLLCMSPHIAALDQRRDRKLAALDRRITKYGDKEDPTS